MLASLSVKIPNLFDSENTLLSHKSNQVSYDAYQGANVRFYCCSCYKTYRTLGNIRNGCIVLYITA